MRGVIYNQEKPYLGLENGRRYGGGGGVERRGGIEGGTTVSYILPFTLTTDDFTSESSNSPSIIIWNVTNFQHSLFGFNLNLKVI